MKSFRALTFNIRCETTERDPGDNWTARRHAVVDFLRASDADIIGLQEVTPEQLAFLVGSMSSTYDYVGVGRNADGSSEASPLFFQPKRLTLVRMQTFWLSESTEIQGSKYPGAGCPRIVTCAELQTVELQTCGASVLFCFNTHLDHIGQKHDHPIQHAQAHILSCLMDRFCNDSVTPRLLLGDFNSNRVAGAPPVFGGAGYNDASGADDQPTRVGFNDETAKHIDWIFARSAELRDYMVHANKYNGAGDRRRKLSDHLPVSATLLLNPGGGSNCSSADGTDREQNWDCYPEKDCFAGQDAHVMQADPPHYENCKQIALSQGFGAFTVGRSGRAFFREQTAEECRASITDAAKGVKLFVLRQLSEIPRVVSWECYPDQDCFAGQDAHVMQSDPPHYESCKRIALSQGFGAFTVGRSGRAFFRKQSAEECRASITDAARGVKLFVLSEASPDIT